MHLTNPRRWCFFVFFSSFLLLAISLFGAPTNGEKKRREPEVVPPIELRGIRYEAVRQGTPYGYKQDGGIIIARDAATGLLKWTQKIYHVDTDHSIEGDKQDVFISAMVLSTRGNSLLITNERGAQFELKLSNRVRRKN